MIYYCCDERRRNAVETHDTLNGIDFLEVLDIRDDPYEVRQRTLFVHFIKDLIPGSLDKENVLIEGGERIRNIKVTNVTTGTPVTSPPVTSPPAIEFNVLVVEVSQAGDFSTYTLRIVRDAKHDDPPPGFDPVLSAIDFSFKVACPGDFDCKPRSVCLPEPGKQPDLNYLAKDYASFRQLMLDRMAVLMPLWKERNPADSGIALVELLAYVADYLSYQQDAVATEAYLGTARKRVSVRRHARLVDYFMHDGSNARCWVQVSVHDGINNILLKKKTGNAITKVITRIAGLPSAIGFNSSDYQKALSQKPRIFEIMHDINLFDSHNELKFYTWGDRECCLPKGAAGATLHGNYPNLKPGDVLVFAEVRGPQTGVPEDADLSHRHAVRLTKVVVRDRHNNTLKDPLNDEPITVIEWHTEDMLPFPLCLSARNGPTYFDNVSIALGNIVLVDHGMTIKGEDLGSVPDSNPVLTKVSVSQANRCNQEPASLTPPRFGPQLKEKPVTHAAAYDPEGPPLSAHSVMNWPMRSVLPSIALNEQGETGDWQPQRDLLNSSPTDKEFVVEIENSGWASIRFGDDQNGSRPASGSTFKATYRVGNGVSGNISAGALAHIVSDDPVIIGDSVITSVLNPLPARGGTEPESIEQVRQNAPSALHINERAVIPADYADIVQRCNLNVQRAAATFRWTGSWRTVFLTVDRLDGKAVDADYERDMRRCIERYRMAGYDLEVDGPRYVPLEIEMSVCVQSNYFRSDVESALLELFSNQVRPDGRKGVFHPDNFTFGQTVYPSSLYAAAQATEGVASVKITKFQRQNASDEEAAESLKKSKLELGRLEIARLDNDPNFPERGIFSLDMKGGR